MTERIQLLNEWETLKREYTLNLRVLQPERGLKDTKKFESKVNWALNKVQELVDTESELTFKVEHGNAKLPKTTIISSCGSWFNCPGRTKGFCEICGFCYDKSPEVRYKKVLASRILKEVTFRALSSEELAEQITEQTKKTTLLNRFNEVGELRSQADLNKVIEISNSLFDNTGVLSYIYTHNRGLDFNQPRERLVINGSNFMVDNCYMVLPKGAEAPKDSKECICDCHNCNLCTKRGNTLVEYLRGA